MAKKKKNKENRKDSKVNRQKEDEEYSLKDYLYINVVFWAFLLVVAIVVFFTTGGKWDPVMKNVFAFIFLVFGGGFLFVSLFDYVYERMAAKDEKK
ncbi:MAG: hypothetical protein ACLFP1_03515 [Candidatus Goldiibacteriota bacterium]